METITNLASTATTAASKLIYGDQTKTNETDGKEPVSGEQGKGTVSEPFDQGNAATPLDTSADKKTFLDYSNNETAESTSKANTSTSGSDDFLKLNPALDGPETKTESSGDPKIYTNRDDKTYTGMPIVPLNPDVATSGVGDKSTSTTEGTGATEKTGTTDKLWKPTEIDDISRSGAPGAGPAAPGSSQTTTSGDIKTTAPDSVTASSEIYGGSSTSTKPTEAHGVDTTKDSKTTTESRDTPSWATTSVPATSGTSDTTKTGTVGESKGLVGEKPSSKSPELAKSSSNDDKGSKMSHLKDKLKDKLHIGSKDK